jgi:hypothetical protein
MHRAVSIIVDLPAGRRADRNPVGPCQRDSGGRARRIMSDPDPGDDLEERACLDASESRARLSQGARID